MDVVEESLAMISDEEGESTRSERGLTTRSSSASFQDSELSDAEYLDSSNDSASDSFEDDDDINPEQEWIDGAEVHPISFPLTANPGILEENAATMTPIDYFKVFFNIKFLTMIAEITNEHARDVLSKGFPSESRLSKWTETNPDELLKFLGILFFMGAVRLININRYWAKSHLVQFNLIKHMSRDRFFLILRMLYFQYKNTGNNIYLKVEPLIHYFNDVMKKTVYPEKELCIDESMFLYRGRLYMRQNENKMLQKFHVKLYIMADPKGLVHRIHMYKGSVDSEIGHAKKVVLKLMNDYLNAGHSVYMDYIFNSVELAEILLSKKTYCTGTLLANRKGNPVSVISKKIRRGSIIYSRNRKGVCVMKWKGKKEILTLSTEHIPNIEKTVNRRGRTVSKPKTITEFNNNMKGIDHHEKLLNYSPYNHKVIRWYKKIGIHLFEMMFVNSYLMYKMGSGKNLSIKDFREAVLSSLLPTEIKNKEDPLATHMPRKLDRNANGVLKRRKCARCWNVFKRRKDSGMYCSDCNVGLCIGCYGPHHVEKELLP